MYTSLKQPQDYIGCLVTTPHGAAASAAGYGWSSIYLVVKYDDDKLTLENVKNGFIIKKEYRYIQEEWEVLS